jgi:predicted O-methyltransferase YrrM
MSAPHRRLIEGNSSDPNVIWQCREWGPFDLIFIDGDHGYEASRNDFENYLPMLSEKGIMVLHDVDVSCRFEGAIRFWHELVSKPNERFHFVTYHNALPHTSNYALGICLPHGLELL